MFQLSLYDSFEKETKKINSHKQHKSSNNDSTKQSSTMTPKERKGYQTQLDLLIEKKLSFEKDHIKTYDTEKKFALEQQIKDLEKQIKNLKKKLESGNENKNEEKVIKPKPANKTSKAVSYTHLTLPTIYSV